MSLYGFGWLFGGAASQTAAGADAESAASWRRRAESALHTALRGAPQIGSVRVLSATEILSDVARQISALSLPEGTPGADAIAAAVHLFDEAAKDVPARPAPARSAAFPTIDHVGPVALRMNSVVYDAQKCLYMLVESIEVAATRLGAAAERYRHTRATGVLRTLLDRAEEHVARAGPGALFAVMELAPDEINSEAAEGPRAQGAAVTVADVCMALGWSLKIVARAAPLAAAGGAVYDLCALVHTLAPRRGAAVAP